MCPASTAPIDHLLAVLHARLLRWCIGRATRWANPVTLMAMALYHEPRSAIVSALLRDPLSAALSDPVTSWLPASVSALLC